MNKFATKRSYVRKLQRDHYHCVDEANGCKFAFIVHQIREGIDSDIIAKQVADGTWRKLFKWSMVIPLR